MQVKNKLQVADAKQAYFRWNASQYEKLPELINHDACHYIQLIPFFLQLNNRLLPGYISADTPVGVYAYIPEKNILDEVKLLNKKFRYQQEGVIKHYAIDAIFFQQQTIDGSNNCWIFYRSSLNKKQVKSLREKTHKISQWFEARGININLICLSDDDFRNQNTEYLSQLNKSLFLDYFYSEAIFLAGKYPLWWLVPPAKEKEYTAFVEHIIQARFVDNEEFLDLGNITGFSRNDLLCYVVDLVQKIKQSPEICLVKLLLADHKNSLWPNSDGVSYRLKKMIYEGKQAVSPVEIIAQIMHEAFAAYRRKKHVLSPDRLFSRLQSIPGKLNPHIVDEFLQDDHVREMPATGIDNIIANLNLYKAIAHEVRQIFSNIVNRYNEQHKATDPDQALVTVARNMQVFLADDADRVPLYNAKDKVDIVLDKICLKHEIISDMEDYWSLVLEISAGNEKTIDGFSSLLGLLTWCWLNRVVNHSTQVSIDCPAQQIKQTEARYVLEVLMQQLKPELISSIPAEAFENPVRPLQTLLFINFMATGNPQNMQVTAGDDPLSYGKQAENLVTHCEQLIINSWGDAYTRQYSGNTGVLKCICDWTHNAPLDSLASPPRLMIFGHGEGDSTYMSQRVEQVYAEMLAFFYQGRHEDGRFILRMGGEYYLLVAENARLNASGIGSQRALLKFLETPTAKYQSTALERFAYTDYPLREIYQLNQVDVIQLFFQVINRSFHCWVLDEKGTICSSVVHAYERESYIFHWLYFFSNIQKRLKKVNYQDRVFPKLEIRQISINQFGGTEFYTVGADEIAGNKNFMDLQVSIKGHKNGDQLSIVCDDRRFEYQEFKQNVLVECVQYLSARMMGEGRYPVYVTDIDVPLRLFDVAQREDIQISHILKFKRNFERRINELLDE